MTNGTILLVMTVLFLGFGYMGVPVAFALMAGGCSVRDPSHARSVSGTIGYIGGSLAIGGSDFTITFPRGALTTSTWITITSDASGYVSYDMKPHGLRFAKPVVVTQSLRNTAVYNTPTALKAACAYFSQDPLNLSGVLKALEIETTTIYSAPNSQQLVPAVETWQLNHFSRYMLASG